MLIRGRKRFYCKDCRFRNERGPDVCFFGKHGQRTEICNSFRMDPELMERLSRENVK